MTETRTVYATNTTEHAGTILGLHGNLSATHWCPPITLPYEQWERDIELLGRLHNASRFWLGDGIEFGKHAYGEKYSQALEYSKLSYGRLANIAYTCRQVDASRRRESLMFEHHTIVAPLPPDEQDHWLDWAEAMGASTDDLSNAIADARNEPPPTSYTDSLERRNGDLSAENEALRQALGDRHPADVAYELSRDDEQHYACPACGCVLCWVGGELREAE